MITRIVVEADLETDTHAPTVQVLMLKETGEDTSLAKFALSEFGEWVLVKRDAAFPEKCKLPLTIKGE